MSRSPSYGAASEMRTNKGWSNDTVASPVTLDCGHLGARHALDGPDITRLAEDA